MGYIALLIPVLMLIPFCMWAHSLPDIDENKTQNDLCIKSHTLYSGVEECKGMPPEEFTKRYRLTNSLEKNNK